MITCKVKHGAKLLIQSQFQRLYRWCLWTDNFDLNQHFIIHDDVIKCKPFQRYCHVCENSPVTCEFPAQRPVLRSFDVFSDLLLINGWVNNGDDGYLRRHRSHYDVTVILICDEMMGGDAFTTFEIQTWLPDFLLGINPFGIFGAWPVWAEIARYIGNKIDISALSTNRQ